MFVQPIAYDLNQLVPFELWEGINIAVQNNFQNFGLFGSTFRDIIHGIPWSYKNREFDVSNLEIYLGCCQQDKIFQRFMAHRESKTHTGGLILGTTDAELAEDLERAGIKLLEFLEGYRKLCMANYYIQGYGKEYYPGDKLFLYITWRINNRIVPEWPKISEREREELKTEIREFINNNSEYQIATSQQVSKVVDGLHLKRARLIPIWYNSHR